MHVSPNALTLSFVAICVIALTIGVAVHAAQAAPERGDPDAYAEYRNDRWHFSLAVPDDMTVGVYDEAGGGQTMQFVDAIGDFKFRVTAWPYSQLDLTLDRAGAPSGASDQPAYLEIVDVVRDDMFTTLFVKNGVRYLVTTIPEREAWLIDILKTWEFTEI